MSTETYNNLTEQTQINTPTYTGELPTLPGDWTWRGGQFGTNGTNKTSITFAVDIDTPGGWIGEIDNWTSDGTEIWTMHIRKIIADGESSTQMAEEETTYRDFDSLTAAIDAVPAHIATYYQ